MLSLLLFASLATTSPEALLVRVQESYKRGDLCADFEQTYVEKLRGKKRVESGKLWTKRDGRVRWSYTRPAKKDFVYDGKTAWFYEPENAQVTELSNFEGSPLWTVVRSLWGQGKVSESFDALACVADCLPAEKGTQQLTLKPKTPLAAVDHVVLVVTAGEPLVQRAVVYDSLGNRSEYKFSAVSIGCKVDNGKLTFTVPQGVSVVRQSGDSLR